MADRLSGNDISAIGQGNVDFDTLRKNAHFVIAKATEGTGFIDPKFIRNRDEAHRVGLPFGSYHFAKPDLGNSAIAEADYYLKTIGTPQDTDILALDYEVSYKNPVTWCKAFLDRIAEKLNGYKALIYMSESVVLQYDWSPVVAAGYGLWIAKYLNNPTPDASFNSGKWPFAAMYQWTSKQVVPGIVGNVDGDVFFGSFEALKKYGYAKPNSQSTSNQPTVTILKSDYDAMNQKISDLSSANQRLTDSVALKDKECQQKLDAQKKEIVQKVINLASAL